MKKFMSIILIYAFFFNTALSASSVQNQTPQVQSELRTILQEYDYMLSAHPNAGSEEFRQKAIQGLKSDVKEFSENKSRVELEKDMNSVIQQIPSKEKREEYRTVIKNASKAKLKDMLANPELMTEALRGSGSNFTGSYTTDMLVYGGIAVLLIALAISAIDSSDDYDYYRSQEAGFNLSSHGYDSCYNAPAPFGTYYLKEEARRRCKNNAERPNTCSFHRWDYDEEYSGYYECSVQAVYRAKEAN